MKSAYQIIQKPECCFVGGSTKEWLQEMMPHNSGEGGFLPRFLIIKEDHKFQRIADPSRALSDREHLELATFRQKVFYDFSRLVQGATGRYDFEDFEASDAYSYWYQTFMPETGMLAPFAARAGAHVLRLALLLSISCYRDSITVVDVETAIKLYAYTGKKLQEVIVPMSPQGKLHNKVLDILANESMSSVQLRRAMKNYCGATDTDRLLQNLIMSKEIALDEGHYRRTRVG